MEIEIDDFIDDASDEVLIAEFLDRFHRKTDFQHKFDKLFKVKVAATINKRQDNLYVLNENLKLLVKT